MEMAGGPDGKVRFMDAQIKNGILEMCILNYIEKESLYGYDIIQSMHEFFPEVTESTFYAILRRLYKEGAAVLYEGQVSKGPVRKYYRITEQGREKLRRMKEEWRYLQSVMAKMGI